MYSIVVLSRRKQGVYSDFKNIDGVVPSYYKKSTVVLYPLRPLPVVPLY